MNHEPTTVPRETTLKQFAIAAMSALMLVSGGLALADEPPANVFPPAEMAHMRAEYENWLNRMREIPAASLPRWEARKADLRKKAMYGFGLDPLPENVPLNLIYGDRHERDDCTVWRVAYQSFPRLYVTAYLTVPKHARFPAPGIVRLMGHEPAWEKGIQGNSAPLARRGYVVLSIKTEHVEALDLGLPIRGVQLWNSMRGLDVLCSLPEVDKTRIGAYGSSGGGMQTMDLAALDDRVKVAAPISYPCAYLRIGMPQCGCNSGPLGALRFMDNHEFLAMIAPRPLAVTCVTGDWTRETLDGELPMASKVFDLYRDVERGPSLTAIDSGAYRLQTSASGRFLAERFNGGHARPPGMYLRTFWWFDWWLQGKRAAPCPAELAEIGDYGSGVDDDKLFDTAAMTCALPKDARRWDSDDLREAMTDTRRHREPNFNSQADLRQWQSATRPLFSKILGEEETLHAVKRKAAVIEARTVDSWRIERLWFDSDPKIRIPAWLIRPADRPKGKRLPATVLLLQDGKDGVLSGEGRAFCAAELAAGRQVLVIDQRMRGEWGRSDLDYEIHWQRHQLLWGRPIAAMAACDARGAADYLAGRAEVDVHDLKIAGIGNFAAVPALLAAALDLRFTAAVCDLKLNDLANGRRPASLAGLEFAGNIDDLAALVAPRRLTLLGVNPATAVDVATKAYLVCNATSKFRHATGNSCIQLQTQDDLGEWELLRGDGPIRWTASPWRSGKALSLPPQQVVAGPRFAVKPYHEYFIHVYGRSPRPTMELSLRRGDVDQRLGTFGDAYERPHERISGFVARPGETSCRLVLTNYAAGNEAPGRVDLCWIEEGAKIDTGPVDERELLTILSPAALPPGPLQLKRTLAPGEFILSYGPTANAQVVEEDGVKALRVPGGEPYMALSIPMSGPLRQACFYRLSVKLRGRGPLNFCFWNIPLPRHHVAELSGDWQTVDWEFFVDGPTCEGPPPTLQFSSELEIRQATLRQTPPPMKVK